MNIIEHIPATASYILKCRGDVLEFKIRLDEAIQGDCAFFRTNLGHAGRQRLEVIALVEKNEPIGATDWFDLPMKKIDDFSYSIRIPLLETGNFAGKAYVLREDGKLIWPNGENTKIKVEPAHTYASNNVYTAFVRQFRDESLEEIGERFKIVSQDMEDNGYTVIPPAGTFRNLKSKVSEIVDELGFRTIQLLPIHPVPTTYGKMGTFGSPFAVLDYFNVDPAYAVLDKRTTPLEQFIELVDAIHAKGARIFMDIPINHTGWASKLQIEHPEWFERDGNNNFLSPGAWGTTWDDLSKLDYSHKGAWEYMASVFYFWCQNGVDGFRCDAGYMIPGEAWTYIIAKVRRTFPDTVFLLENLGGYRWIMEQLLAVCGMNWAYSEIFQQYNRSELEYNIPTDKKTSLTKGVIINYAETHDNNRLATVSRKYAKLRVALAALVSSNGAYGITNGVEWFAKQKVEVHGATPLNWGNQDNQIAFIKKINAILRTNSSFFNGALVNVQPHDGANSLVILRENQATGEKVICLFNLDNENQCSISFYTDKFGGSCQLFDMLSDKVIELNNGDFYCELAAAEVLCLTDDPSNIVQLQEVESLQNSLCEVSTTQTLKAVAMEAQEYLTGKIDLQKTPDELAASLKINPSKFCAMCLYGFDNPEIDDCPSPTEVIDWSEDKFRVPVVAWNYYAYVTCDKRFSLTIHSDERDALLFRSLPQADGKWFVLIPNPNLSKDYGKQVKIDVVQYGSEQNKRETGCIYFAGKGNSIEVQTSFTRAEVIAENCSALCTNERGGMAMVRGSWGTLHSIYDAMLAANMHHDVPVDRHIMLSRCRAWAIYRDYSTEINIDCLKTFSKDEHNNVFWNFEVPIGMGKFVALTISFGMKENYNGIFMYIKRNEDSNNKRLLDATNPIQIVVRPDIENRTNHEVTKSFAAGIEKSWPYAIKGFGNGFTFANQGYHMRMQSTTAHFYDDNEWIYMVHRPFEATRGLEADSDLFSPGYFKSDLSSNETIKFTAAVIMDGDENFDDLLLEKGDSVKYNSVEKIENIDKFEDAMIKDFVVKRDDCKTVIAGYPWFLDWGRDTLICLRGMIAKKMFDDCRTILVQFARFEKDGTLPNMIRGNDDSNRDTSDAPLWYCIVCADLYKAEKTNDFLEADCGNGRKVSDTIISIVEGYIKGTKNNIKMDEGTGLIFSPSHYTWMDTNYPAGTPREGYPIEIQALWYAALKFVSEISAEYRQLAEKVQKSIHDYYLLEDGYLADCLNANIGQMPKDAQVDDALRPNQLLAITLGAIEDKKTAKGILNACSELIAPGTIRSLSKRSVKTPLSIYENGNLLNDPHNPYWGHYEGDEDTRRKPAYHNGTCWGWVFPLYPEALYVTYGEEIKQTAKSILSSVEVKLNTDCICQLTEVADGDAPHTVRGCPAQAWSVTELARVRALLK
ncbi:MAG: glycogen debranching enzyme N-terminal domain-containing protein [Kiritimatiellae bacterium]|jgi:starch synthase (maltosyl-transferring)|nr:glycogen debranching enzyme N-terminal domain-containing protein [Kiritimatiellia bacterium]